MGASHVVSCGVKELIPVGTLIVFEVQGRGRTQYDCARTVQWAMYGIVCRRAPQDKN